MKELSRSRVLPSIGLCAFFALSVAGCHDHYDDDDDHGNPGVPTFFEVEPNDDSFTANDFGFLSPGDHFFIEGYITDSGFDPFDGFWFTSNGPIHVDFQLFIDEPSTDLDVCLYDPVLDVNIDCYQSPANPEQGGIDVTAGNIDFHLVVESFVGASTYGLEIVVLPLAPLPAAISGEGAAPGAARAPVATLRSVPSRNAVPRAGATDDSFRAYARGAGTNELKTVARSHIEVDAELGLVVETTTVEHVPLAREQASVKVR